MKKVLLVGSSFSAMPLLEELKKRAFHVSVCGKYRTDPCHYYADNSFFIDYSKKEELLKIVKDNKFDYIIPSCNDASYNSCSWVQNKILKFNGLDDMKTTEIMHIKNKFRKYLINKNLPCPAFESSYEKYIKAKHPFPCIIKPVDSFSGKGITLIKNDKECKAGIDKAKAHSINNDYVIEEFIEGTLHSHSAFIKNKKIDFDFFVDEFCTVYPYQVDCSNHPSKLNNSIKNKIRKSLDFIVKDLQLVDGLIHTQLIVNDEDFWIIETMRRAPGDLYGTLIENSCGINYWENYIKPFINERINKGKLLLNKMIARHTISSNKLLSSKSFKTTNFYKSIEIFQLKDSGLSIDAAPFDKMSIIFLEFKNEEDLLKYSSKLSDKIIIKDYELEKK